MRLFLLEVKMKRLSDVNIGKTFKIAGFTFIKFSENNGESIIVLRNNYCQSRFGKNNNFSESEIKKILEQKLLPILESEIGAENIIEHEVDLLSHDGDDKWGKPKCKISIPTFDFYRHNVKIFDKYKLDEWCWLATPDSTSNHCDDNCVLCVSPHGDVLNCDASFICGVRPFCIVKSSIFVS